MQGCRAEVAQTLVNLEALEKRVGVVEDVLVHVGVREVGADIQKMNEEISANSGELGGNNSQAARIGFRGGKGPSSVAHNKSGVDYKED